MNILVAYVKKVKPDGTVVSCYFHCFHKYITDNDKQDEYDYDGTLPQRDTPDKDVANITKSYPRFFVLYNNKAKKSLCHKINKLKSSKCEKTLAPDAHPDFISQSQSHFFQKYMHHNLCRQKRCKNFQIQKRCKMKKSKRGAKTF